MVLDTNGEARTITKRNYRSERNRFVTAASNSDTPARTASTAPGGRRFECVATTLPGLEAVLSRELETVGVSDVEPLRSAVRFSADHQRLYSANLRVRTALRILVPIARFAAPSTDQLYQECLSVPWQRYLSPSSTFAVRALSSSPAGDDPRFVALRVKDALVDAMRKRFGRRPNVDVRSPDVQITIHWDQGGVVVNLDSSGESLHRRGYRSERTEAPLSEVLGAGMVLLSGWDRQSTLYNPMCGSGTIAIEAALIGADIAPGLLRLRFGFQSWKDYDEALWKRLQAEAVEQARTSSSRSGEGSRHSPVIAGDIDPEAVRVAVRNLERTGFTDLVRVMRRDLLEQEPPAAVGEHPVVVINPPYGKRLQEPEIETLYARIGDRLKEWYPGWDAWIISGNRAAMKRIGLRTAARIPLFNGPIECRYHHYPLYRSAPDDRPTH